MDNPTPKRHTILSILSTLALVQFKTISWTTICNVPYNHAIADISVEKLESNSLTTSAITECQIP